jgi:hypothetical protein
MNRKDGTAMGSDLLDDLRLGPSRGAPPGAALRVEERLRRTIAGHDGANDKARAFSSVPKRRSRFGGFPVRAAALVAAVLLTGALWAAVRTVIARHRAAPAESADPIVTPSPKGPSVENTSPSAPADDPSEATSPPKSPSPPGVPTAIGSNHSDPKTTGSSDLVAERAMLDRARKAFGDGAFADAEQILDTHTHRFAAGLLAEEREALIVKTLAAEGRNEEARARATRFHAHFPRSLFGSGVENAVRTIP